jgi:hypothetical protein
MGKIFLRISRVSDRDTVQVRNLQILDPFRWINCTIYGAMLGFDSLPASRLSFVDTIESDMRMLRDGMFFPPSCETHAANPL